MTTLEILKQTVLDFTTEYEKNPSIKNADQMVEAIREYFNYEEEEFDDDPQVFAHLIPGANILEDTTEIDGIVFPTGMHAFQSFKLCYTANGFDMDANKDKRENFAHMTLNEAIQIGKSKIEHFDPVDWDQRKNEIMKLVLVNMFFGVLPEGEIIQCGIDSYFGAENGGKNVIGKLLMEIREEQKEENGKNYSKKNGKKRKYEN